MSQEDKVVFLDKTNLYTLFLEGKLPQTSEIKPPPEKKAQMDSLRNHSQRLQTVRVFKSMHRDKE